MRFLAHVYDTLLKVRAYVAATCLAAKPGKPKSDDLFTCPACGTGPWHRSWGRLCPNCTGAD